MADPAPREILNQIDAMHAEADLRLRAVKRLFGAAITASLLGVTALVGGLFILAAGLLRHCH